jgi:hypothetical protein
VVEHDALSLARDMWIWLAPWDAYFNHATWQTGENLGSEPCYLQVEVPDACLAGSTIKIPTNGGYAMFATDGIECARCTFGLDMRFPDVATLRATRTFGSMTLPSQWDSSLFEDGVVKMESSSFLETMELDTVTETDILPPASIRALMGGIGTHDGVTCKDAVGSGAELALSAEQTAAGTALFAHCLADVSRPLELLITVEDGDAGVCVTHDDDPDPALHGCLHFMAPELEFSAETTGWATWSVAAPDSERHDTHEAPSE